MSEYYRVLRTKIGSQRIFTPSVAAVIHNQDGDILFQLPAADSEIWSLPAGAIEIGETPAEAIVREVYEETGLHVHVERILAVCGGQDFRYTYADGNEVEYLVVVFACAIVGGQLEAIDGESVDLRYFSPLALPRLALPYPNEIFQARTRDRAWFQNRTTR